MATQVLEHHEVNDWRGHEHRHFVVQSLTSDPAPSNGRVIYRSDLQEFRICVNGSWETVNTGDLDDDAVKAIIGASISGTGAATATYDAQAGTVTIHVPPSEATYDDEAAQDAIAAAIAAGTHSGITINYNDPGNSFTFTVTDSPTVGGQTPQQLHDSVVEAIVDGAPGTLDTLREIAEALQNNPDVIQDLLAAQALRVRTYAETVGNGSTSDIAVVHDLGTRDITVAVRRMSDNMVVSVPWTASALDTATIHFDSNIAANSYRVVVQGRPD